MADADEDLPVFNDEQAARAKAIKLASSVQRSGGSMVGTGKAGEWKALLEVAHYVVTGRHYGHTLAQDLLKDLKDMPGGNPLEDLLRQGVPDGVQVFTLDDIPGPLHDALADMFGENGPQKPTE